MTWSADRIQIGLTALCGVCLAMALVALIPGWTFGTSAQWSIPAVLFGAYFAIKSGFASIRERSFDVNLLMVIAAVGAIAVGHTEDAAVLLFLFSLGSTLEAMAMAKTQSAIEALVRLRPDEALRVTDSGDERVRVETLVPGDTVRVLPFEPIPADGVMLSEHAGVNQSAMTGESIPVEKRVGDTLMAGTQNLDQMLLCRVSHGVGDSTLDKIVELVREAQDNKASGERISKWFGERYTIFVVVAFLISLGARAALGATWNAAFYSSLILLVALSPCALVISSPAASLSALAHAARKGILVRGGEYMEEAGRITMLAMDKTGTLTEGRPKVVEICTGLSHAGQECKIVCWHQEDALGSEASQALTWAAGAEQFSTHPIADSIVSHARALGLEVPEARSHQAHAGLGVEAELPSGNVRVGQPKFFDGAEMPQEFVEHVDEMRSRGVTAVLVNQGEHWAAIGLRDEPRAESADTILAFQKAGVKRIAMLTGDNSGTAAAVAGELGITEVHSALMPESKQRLIEGWVKEGERVMMVGDGINDAPALSTAHLGVAMGGLGSEVALRAADVVLVQDRIQLLPHLIRLGRMTNQIIRVNLIFAAGVIVALTLSSFFLNLPLAIAVLGHEGSTVLVILNGLRLLGGPRTQ